MAVHSFPWSDRAILTVKMRLIPLSFAVLAVAVHALPGEHLDSPQASEGWEDVKGASSGWGEHDSHPSSSGDSGSKPHKKPSTCAAKKPHSDHNGHSGSSSDSWSGGNGGSGSGRPLDDWFMEPLGPDPAVPTATLLPSTHWSHDKYDLDHIRPSGSKDQYYMPGDASWSDAHQFGWVSADYNDDIVMLDHSDLYTWTYASSTGKLSVSFEDEDAFELAKKTWHKSMIVAFYDGTCGTAMNCYVICNELSFDAASQSCTMSTSPAKFEDIYSYFTFEWGHFKPGHGGSPTTPNKPGWTATTATTSSTPTSTNIIGNFSVGFNPDDVNCTAPPDTVNGLPTACLGPYFDEDLDDSYGYNNLDNAPFGAFAEQLPGLWYTGIGEFDQEDFADDDVALGFSKRKRFSFLGLEIPNPIQLIKDNLPAVPGITAPYDINLGGKTIDLNIPRERQKVSSPWGEQVLIKSFSSTSSGGAASGKIDLFCVDCGASGKADISGRIGVSLTGVDYVRADLDVNFAVGLKLGLVAEATYNDKIVQPLFVVPLGPINAGIASIGPMLKAGVDLQLNLAAKGDILAGGTFSITNAKASIEVTSIKGTASGWTPAFESVFRANGEIAASADLGVPIAVSLGISALSYTAGASLVDRPAIVAKAQASVSANTAGAGFVTVDGCTGISTSLSWKNELYGQLNFGSNYGTPFPLYGPIGDVLASKCIDLPAAPPTARGISERRSPSSTYPVLNRRQSNGTTLTDTTSLTLSNATTNSTPFSVPQSNDVSYSLADGYYISTLVDSTGSVQLYSCLTGNIHVYGTTENDAIAPSDCSPFFTFYDDPSQPGTNNVTVADGYSSLFVYFPDEMAKTGVSRIRLVDTENIPKGSEDLLFGLSGDGSSPQQVYYPFDRLGDVFYPVMCRYKSGTNAAGDLPNKVFVVKDLVAGPQVLVSEALKYTVTGGEVDQCWVLPLIDGTRYGEEEGNGGSFEYEDDA